MLHAASSQLLFLLLFVHYHTRSKVAIAFTNWIFLSPISIYVMPKFLDHVKKASIIMAVYSKANRMLKI